MPEIKKSSHEKTYFQLEKLPKRSASKLDKSLIKNKQKVTS